ncbi:uncharacterized protein LOC126803860 [Argentina anserina]|uniref:uncharacterized protein LOC126803860 n=1 Tax=Argentina anserina TaxID=57926 RepID=UPI002176741A|nr:uncharacterized protein LOC126803860 [Potentilla anserina]
MPKPIWTPEDSMDHNKSEAIKAKAHAERKLLERNYATAKNIALLAQKLCPELEGLSQLLTIIDIYICGENKTIGDADWYGILGVIPYANYALIKKQYRRLALMLHPDRNKSPGAEGAFKLVSEAWDFLSDKAKRDEYERLTFYHSRTVENSRQGALTNPVSLSKQPGANAFQNVRNSAASPARSQHGSMHSYEKPTTFWTICNLCSTYHQYVRTYLNHTLMCPTCQKGFTAIETAPPAGVSESSSSSSCQEHHTSRHHGAASGRPINSGRNNAGARNLGNKVSLASKTVNKTTFQQCFVFSTAVSGCATAVSVAQQGNEIVKRQREERVSIAEWERNQKLMENSAFKKKRIEDKYLISGEGYMANEISVGIDGANLGGVSESGTGNAGTKKIYGFSSMDNMPNCNRELSYHEMQNLLIKKAQTDISKKLKDMSSATVTKKHEEVEVDKEHKNMVSAETQENNDEDNDARFPISTNVPDPDFHDFDLDRTERSFQEEQVWAAYDGDGLPRYYARIQNVISRKPFKLCISWLNSRNNSELGSLDWIGSGFAKTCGDFRPGKRQTYKTLNSFSKKVSWKKAAHGMIRVYPGKMEVWALYRNWSPDWNQHTPDEVINRYEMVEVLDDFTEVHGVSVLPLIKVAGFRTVFQRNMDPKAARRIPKEEMFQFSHIVPCHLLTGKEAHNAPKGCFELDPAAIPLHLLEVITEDNQAPMADHVGKTKEEVIQSALAREVDAGVDEGRFQKGDDKPLEVHASACLVGQGN